MNRLRFEIEWEDPAAAAGLELRATWAHLRIFVDDECVTQVHDLAARSVRSGIYLSLYPLAEWLATHWWSLFAELENPRRTEPAEYLRRHNLRYGRDGFAFPNLVFCPLNGHVTLSWADSAGPAEMVRFLSQGKVVLPAADVDAGLKELVEAVIRRLDQSEVPHTVLHEEWRAVCEADADERAFCMAAAALGQDPYSLDDKVSEDLLEVSSLLPVAVTEDFFASAEVAQMLDQARQVALALQKASSQDIQLQTVMDLRRDLQFQKEARQPWGDGYAWARRLRQELKLNGQIPGNIRDIGVMFGIDPTDFNRAVNTGGAVHPVFDAVMNINSQQSPGFVLRRQNQSNLKFSFCRALIEYLAADQPGPALVAADYSLRQKRNRAFAAEFLVPSEELQKALPGPYLGPEELDVLARKFKASPWLVRHQLENHNLARLAPLSGDF
ncbi:MAG: ImmA/IrrE family metallo-endopeptidase [Desulfuromonadales bacterium]